MPCAHAQCGHLTLTCADSPVSAQSRDRDHRKSAGKPGLDTSGNLYQYDNYDEVAMDTDSETGSPGKGAGGAPDAPFASCFPFKLVCLRFSPVANAQQPAVCGGGGVHPSPVRRRPHSFRNGTPPPPHHHGYLPRSSLMSGFFSFHPSGILAALPPPTALRHSSPTSSPPPSPR